MIFSGRKRFNMTFEAKQGAGILVLAREGCLSTETAQEQPSTATPCGGKKQQQH